MKKRRRAQPKSAQLRELALILWDIDPERMRTASRKTSRLDVRVSPIEKAQMAIFARRLGITVSEYVIQLHRLAAIRLSK